MCEDFDARFRVWIIVCVERFVEDLGFRVAAKLVTRVWIIVRVVKLITTVWMIVGIVKLGFRV